MNYINRSAIYVKAKMPYQTWANGLDDQGPLFDINNQDGSVYLALDELAPDKVEDYIKKVYQEIFEHELLSWHTHTADWPSDRTYSVFNEWFEVKYASGVIDICELPLYREE